MITAYYSRPLDAFQRQRLLEEGKQNAAIKGRTLKDALAKSGYIAFVFPGASDDGQRSLYWHLARGRPLIAMQRLDAGAYHYVVVSGYDAGANVIIVLDPSSGQRFVSAAEFHQKWEPTERFVLVAAPGRP